MFNLAKSRMKDEEPRSDKLLKAVHKSKLKARDASVQDDAGNIARLCAQMEQDPQSIMDDEYWTWVKEHDEDYYLDVARKAKAIAKQMSHEAENPSPDAKYVPAAPIPKQKPGGGGAMASRPVLFLKRNVGKYRLSGTIVGDLLSGELPFLDEEGKAFLMELKDGSSVDRFGPSAIEALKIQDSLPESMRAAVAKFLSSMGRDDARSLARSIIARYLRKKKLDMLPLSAALHDERRAFLLRLGLETEPQECQLVREEMGKAMAPMISKLRDALLMDGIETSESPAPMPAFTAQGKEAIERIDVPFMDSSSSPEVMTGEDVEDSIDVPSLVMTISASSTDRATRSAAVERLVEIICRFPAVYEKYELSESDLNSISSACGGAEPVKRLVAFAKLFRSDDAEIMAAYAANEDDRGLLAALVGGQGRRNIIDAVPEMCLHNGVIVHEFMKAVDPSKSLRFLESLVPEGDDCPEKIISRKIIEAIWRNPGSGIVEKALGSFKMARDFAVLTLLERDPVAASNALEAMPGKADPSWHGTLVASAFARRGDDEDMKLAYFVTGARPIDVMEFAGRKAAAAYMRANRIGPEGDPIPEASRILSAPEDPLPLAKSLNAMGDHQAMLILMRACARRARRGHAKEMWYALSFMSDALRAAGFGGDASEILSSIGVRIDDDAGTIKRASESRIRTANGVLVGRRGVYVHDGVAYACDEETAASMPLMAEDFGSSSEKMY